VVFVAVSCFSSTVISSFRCSTSDSRPLPLEFPVDPGMVCSSSSPGTFLCKSSASSPFATEFDPASTTARSESELEPDVAAATLSAFAFLASLTVSSCVCMISLLFR
jgi:hypothetical protein